MDYLHLFIVASLSVTVFAKCTDDGDCANTHCGPGTHGVCVLQSGSGGGSGERACECVHHKRLVLNALVCASDSDCTQWAHDNHCGRAACEIQHGAGVGAGEKNCVCKSHNKRATGCCTTSDCDAVALGCDLHHNTLSCEIQHGSGHGCGENKCVCLPKHG